ncbi:hypothetical protein B0H13DRAFT_1038522 [Mycena leptocephala]|nr:hypothetical protein B0H13DRAFT_1038522 [Mycena leptocephala]
MCGRFPSYWKIDICVSIFSLHVTSGCGVCNSLFLAPPVSRQPLAHCSSESTYACADKMVYGIPMFKRCFNTSVLCTFTVSLPLLLVLFIRFRFSATPISCLFPALGWCGRRRLPSAASFESIALSGVMECYVGGFKFPATNSSPRSTDERNVIDTCVYRARKFDGGGLRHILMAITSGMSFACVQSLNFIKIDFNRTFCENGTCNII